MNQNGIEMALIGTVLNDNTLIKQTEVTATMFVNRLLGDIWQIISDAVASGRSVDVISISDDLRDMNETSLYELLDQCLVSGFSNIMALSYGEKIFKNWQTREVIKIAEELSADPDNYQEAIRQLMAIGQSGQNFDLSIKEVLTLALAHIEEVSQSDGITGVTTGILRLDEVLGGFHEQDLVIIASRPSMGKTSLMLNMLKESHCSAGVFSAEMGRVQVGERLLSISSGVEAQKIRTGKIDSIDYGEMVDGSLKLTQSEIRINDKPAPTLGDIVNQSRKWKLEYDIKIIYIDYLQRIKLPGRDPRHERVGEAARTLKELARELDIPVVVLAQVNRDADGRRPTMADLAQSGEIEAEADVIIFIYRDEVYNKESKDKGIAELLIGKNRHGAVGDVRTIWIEKSMQFKDMSHVTYHPEEYTHE